MVCVVRELGDEVIREVILPYAREILYQQFGGLPSLPLESMEVRDRSCFEVDFLGSLRSDM
jgi:hypothetical protein